MIKVVNDVFDDNRECYVYTLENDDQISVSEWEYSTMKLFKSEKGLTYKPVVNENEDADDLNIEYVGFQLIN